MRSISTFSGNKGRRRVRVQAVFLLLVYLVNFLQPLTALALTSGPSAPETQGFTAVSTSDLVDPFTGNFGYTVPLMDVGGYPLNLSYSGSISADQEASWVGLGWSLSPGAINRQLRSVPDDFDGSEKIQRQYNIKTNWTAGLGVDFPPELFGIDLGGGESSPLSVNAGIFYNSYNGPGLEYGISVSSKINKTLGGSLSCNFNSQSGTSLSGGLSLSANVKDKANASIGLSGGINSRQGFTGLSLNYSLAATKNVESASSTADASASQASQPKVSESAKPNGAENGATATQNASTENPGFAAEVSKQVEQSLISNSASLYTAATPTMLSGEKEFSNSNVSVRVGLGLDIPPGTFVKIGLRGYYAEQRLAKKTYEETAVGSLYHQRYYLHDQTGSHNYILDFDREKDQPFSKYSTMLAMPYGGADYFAVEGKDVGGTFQLTRNDIDVYFDPYSKSTAQGINAGVEFGASISQHLGADVNTNNSSTTTTKWTEENAAIANLYNVDYTQTDLSEPYAFKNIGETNVAENLEFLESLGGTAPTSPFVLSSGQAPNPLTASQRRTNRESRKSVMSHLTAAQTNTHGLDKKIRNCKLNTPRVLSNCMQLGTHYSELDYVNGSNAEHRKAHHLGEITVTNDAGMRYVYGLPVYNHTTVESSFRLESTSSTHTVNYNTSNEATKENNKGKDHYYERSVTPAYAYSYLITGVLSPDYVDITGNGISDDDLGSAVRFNYGRHQEKYRWRTPATTQANSAYYQEGMYARDFDQMGSYTYGEKEIWYTYSIESKNEVAFFYTSPTNPRHDGLGVQGEHGGIDGSMTLLRLDSIELYSKGQLACNPGTPPVPTKTVHFEYDYSLCKGVPNNLVNTEGKLTLKRVFFTHGANRRGAFNAYVFDYGTNNPNYTPFEVDGWGNYQKREGAYAGYPNPQRFPFTIQDAAMQQQYCDAWCLRVITLPSGGQINVDYEPDEYAYVQSKRVGQMVPIEKIGKTNDFGAASSGNNLYGLDGSHDYVFFKVGSDVDNTNIYEKHLADISGSGFPLLYFSCMVQMQGSKYEQVKGYGKVVPGSWGVDVEPDGSRYGYVKLEPLTEQKCGPVDCELNPILLASLQTLRLQLPEIAYEGTDLQNNVDILDVIGALIGMIADIKDKVMGFNYSQMSELKCRHVKTGSQGEYESFMRVVNPNNKIGGGNRVKYVSVSDQWSSMATSGVAASYGQAYTYEDGAGNSFGVASWEPYNIGEENLHRKPLQSDTKAMLGPKSSFYVETPMGESLYPVASVGYQQVTVENVYKNGAATSWQATHTGKTVHEFYTAKEFPTRTSFTSAAIKPNDLTEGGGILKLIGTKMITASQGYVIETNDMHGKQKRTSVYDANANLLSSKEYKYWVDNDGAVVKRLNNTVPALSRESCGQTSVTIGLDYNVWADSRQQVSQTTSGGVSANLENLVIIPIPIPLPNIHKSTTQYRSLVVTKHINRHGLLRSVITTENGSSVSTENLFYDKGTGRVLVTATQDEFDDPAHPVYSITYPAYWVYQALGPSYKNQGARLTLSTAAGPISVAGASTGVNDLLFAGDLLILEDGGLAKACHVTDVNGVRYLIDKNGDLVTTSGPVQAVVYRSSFKNLPQLNAQEIVTKYHPYPPDCECSEEIDEGEDPDDGHGGSAAFVQQQDPDLSHLYTVLNNDRPYAQPRSECVTAPRMDVLDIKAYTYSELWKKPVGPVYQSFNPYHWGVLGNWRLRSSFGYFTARNPTVSVTSGQPDTRMGGHYNASLFWYKEPDHPNYWNNALTLPDGTEANDTWVKANTVTLYDEKGNEVENKDALGVYSAAVYGYNMQIPVATASNARYNQIAFDGFEDYSYQSGIGSGNPATLNAHFTFGPTLIAGIKEVSADRAHTGKSSLKMVGGSSGVGSWLIFEQPLDYLENLPFAISPLQQEYKLRRGGMRPTFHFNKGKYLLSLWVSEADDCNCPVLSHSNVSAIVEDQVVSGNQILSFEPQGPIIDGWQRYECVIDIQGNAPKVTLQFEAEADKTVYFDDVRIQPYRSNMKSFVYDPATLRLMSILDENNYASFYEYDEAGQLVRVKKETDKGVMTLQETRNYLKKQ